jgi:hypothetical protein
MINWTTKMPVCKNKTKSPTDDGKEGELHLVLQKWIQGGSYSARVSLLRPYREKCDPADNNGSPNWLSWFDKSGNVYYLNDHMDPVIKWAKLSEIPLAELDSLGITEEDIKNS